MPSRPFMEIEPDAATPTPDPRTRVYVADAAGSTITVFALDPIAADLALVQRLELAAGAGPLAITPDRRFLYAQLRGDRPSVVSMRIDPATGMLEIVATTPMADPMVYLQTDRSARYLLGASYTGAVFAIHAIDARGVVAERPAQVTSTPPHAHCIVPDPENRYLFVTSLGGDVILQYLYDAAAGRAIPNDPPFRRTPPGSGPRHLIFHPNGGVVYVNGELDGSIGVYAFDRASGRLEEIQHLGIMPGAAGAAVPWGADLHLTPDGRYLYASERRTGTLAVCVVRAGSGLLDRRHSIATEAQPRSFAIDLSGRFLFAAGERSGRLAMYEIDSASGRLGLRGSYPVGEKPGWVSVAALAS